MLLGSMMYRTYLPGTQNLVGIEFEAENCHRYLVGDFRPVPGLDDHDDPSLRNGGREFTTPPLGVDTEELSGMVQQFYTLATAADFTFGSRTSTHIHIDVRDLSLKEISLFLALMIALEPTYLRMCSPYRRNNLFCRPLSTCPQTVQYIQDLYLYTPTKNKLNTIDMFALTKKPPALGKYCAVGTFRLWDLGTVEFRALHGGAGADYTLEVAEFLCAIKDFVRGKSAEELADCMLRGYQQLLRLVLGDKELPTYPGDYLPATERECLRLARSALLLLKVGQDIPVVTPEACTNTVTGAPVVIEHAPVIPAVLLPLLVLGQVGETRYGFRKITETKYSHAFITEAGAYAAQYCIIPSTVRESRTFIVGEL